MPPVVTAGPSSRSAVSRFGSATPKSWEAGARSTGKNDAMSDPTNTIRIAFVQSCWHRDLVDRCHDGFLDRLPETSLRDATVERHEVPGAFEIPLYALDLARSGQVDAIVAAGLVVDGGIYRHEFVADAVISGLMRVQLDTGVPVLSSVLTPHQFHEHDAHHQFFESHLYGKGAEAADACAAVLASRSWIEPRAMV